MSKTEKQVIKFLEKHSFKSVIDWKIISSFCKVELNLNLELNPKISLNGLDSLGFSLWYENGFGCGDIAWYEGNLVILGSCTYDTVKIEGTLLGSRIDCTRFTVATSKLLKTSKVEIAKFKQALAYSKLQFSEEYQMVIERYIPHINERISFFKDNVRGLGVIRSISTEKDYFELYCYHIYQTDETRYSMHERIEVLSEYTFIPMTISERRRLENKLRRLGKSWNDKMHRIEPIEPKAKIGEKYWYINDKMKMTTAIEEGKPTSHFRYLGGNYFLTQEDCLANLGKIHEILRDFLAD